MPCWSAVAKASPVCASWRRMTGRKWPAEECLCPAHGWLNKPARRVSRWLWIVVARALRPCWRRCGLPRSRPPDTEDGYVSEAAPAQDEVQVAPVQSPAPVTAAPRGRGLASLALVLAAVSVGLAWWGVWQVRALHLQSEQQREVLEQTRSQAQTLVQREQSLSAQLAQLPTPEQLEERRQLLASVQGDQQRLGQRLDNVLNASRQDWRLAEAEHLLRLASLRLTALQEINRSEERRVG